MNDQIRLLEQRITVMQKDISILQKELSRAYTETVQAIDEMQNVLQSLGGFVTAGMQSLDARLRKLEPSVREDDTGKEL